MANKKPDNVARIGVDGGVYLESVRFELVMAVNTPLVVWPWDEELSFFSSEHPFPELDFVWEHDFVHLEERVPWHLKLFLLTEIRLE